MSWVTLWKMRTLTASRIAPTRANQNLILLPRARSASVARMRNPGATANVRAFQRAPASILCVAAVNRSQAFAIELRTCGHRRQFISDLSESMGNRLLHE